MIDPIPRVREWPANDLALFESVVGFLEFVSVTAINKLEGLSEEQARATPLATSPAMSILGLIKHLTAGQRQHIQRHIGGRDLPSLWRADDTTFEFRLEPDETIATVVAAFDDELKRSRDTLASIDPEASVLAETNARWAGPGRLPSGVGSPPRPRRHSEGSDRRKDGRMSNALNGTLS